MSRRTEIDHLNGARGQLGDPDPAERAKVRQWRAMRMSWAAIARNLGRSEPDVRKAFEYNPEAGS